MLDIVILIFLCIRIRNIVQLKGHHPSPWVLRTVVLWIAAEMAGIIIPYLLHKDIFISILSGLLCAAGSYLFIRDKALKLPDLNKERDWRDHIGPEQDRGL